MDYKNKEVGNRIRQARKQLNLSQAELSEKLDISPSHMSDIENGKTNLGLDIFMKLTEALQVSADWLLRTNVPPVEYIFNNELQNLISDCSPRETQALLKILKEVKKALQDAKKEGASDY